ncbi:MAG: hypothetical protein KGL53_10630, partial [Elusimicrobia bacterium]|nr:hypothetical protein [Elusimicrobiota bacterium]
ARAIADQTVQGVAAAVGAGDPQKDVRDDEASYRSDVGFSNSGPERKAIPTKKCDRHYFGQVGICPE